MSKYNGNSSKEENSGEEPNPMKGVTTPAVPTKEIRNEEKNKKRN